MVNQFIKPKYLIIILPVIIILWLVYSACSIASFGSHSYEKPADGIIVLGTAVFGLKPSPVFRERINHGIDLYSRKLAPVIIFTGGRGEGQRISEAESARQYAEAQGVPSKDILIETNSRTTEQNLYYARQVSAGYGIKRVIIVSDPMHMKRAMLMAKDMGFEAYSSPTPTSRFISPGKKAEFLLRELYYYQRYLVRRHFYRFGS